VRVIDVRYLVRAARPKIALEQVACGVEAVRNPQRAAEPNRTERSTRE
jgi:hypothetical protein